MTSVEIREKFLEFFKSKQHKIVQSAPVVPFADPTLLFVNAGMNQFKDVFLGEGKRDYTRCANTQKCIRVSGKHNDLEEVGYDTYHHTFFEMLGNWSFGDYYKKEAITWAWEFLTDVVKLPKERLWITVYKTDDEAFSLWKEHTDVNPSHILRFAEKDNFWEMGDTGPCGPCSEIHINLTDDYDNPSLVNAGSPECIELWNLVFIQYNRNQSGTLEELPAKHVDTGMGFERLCAVLQNKKSNYETDVFSGLINKVSELSGVPADTEQNLIPMRVIADHIRTLSFAIADGAVPGNEGRSYVLRRILRRAARYGRNLSLKEPFLYKLADVLEAGMGTAFPELSSNLENIKKIIKAEEESFNAALDRGLELFEQIVSGNQTIKSGIISGENVFKLYDTYGFPVDLTNILAKERGLSIDETGFNKLMSEQKEKARKSTKDKISGAGIEVKSLAGFEISDNTDTKFAGYSSLVIKSKVTGVKSEGEKLFIITAETPFYTESGGQASDEGTIELNAQVLEVAGLVKTEGKTVHICSNETGVIVKPGDMVTLAVDSERRENIKRNHSATHLLHKALREVLGKHVQQAGSYVGPERLRFDFSHYAKVTSDELSKIEKIVNAAIRRNIVLEHHKETPFDKAKEMGALMFFGDKYGDKVNVVQFGDESIEFCGGTHVSNTSEIGLFKITAETSIASGIRRIEAVTGYGAEMLFEEKEHQIEELKHKIEQILEEKKSLEKEIASFRLQEKLGGLDSVLKESTKVSDINVYKGKVEAENMDQLKSMGDDLRNRMKSGVGVLVSEFEGKAGIVCVVSDCLIKERNLSAGKIVGEVAKILGGGGGGKAHLATAGGKDTGKIPEALSNVEEVINKLI